MNLDFFEKYRVIFVKYLDKTEKSPARIKITDKERKQSKIIKRNTKYESYVIQAAAFLHNNGFRIKGCGDTEKNETEYIFLVDNFLEFDIDIKDCVVY